MRTRLVFGCAAIVLSLGLAVTSTAGAVSLAAPDPGGDPSAPVPLPPPAGKYMGFNDDSAHDLHGLEPADYVELSGIAGGNLIRASLDWRDAEPDEDRWHSWSWARWQELYDSALEGGVTPLFTIGFAPVWARASEIRPAPSAAIHRRLRWRPSGPSSPLRSPAAFPRR
jgi:hypothetical protein